MNPEDRLVRRIEAAIAAYDAAKLPGEGPAPAWLEDSIRRMREAIASYRKVHPRPEDHPHITCPRCGRTSYHPQDIANRFCAACGFWGDGP